MLYLETLSSLAEKLRLWGRLGIARLRRIVSLATAPRRVVMRDHRVELFGSVYEVCQMLSAKMSTRSAHLPRGRTELPGRAPVLPAFDPFIRHVQDHAIGASPARKDRVAR